MRSSVDHLMACSFIDFYSSMWLRDGRQFLVVCSCSNFLAIEVEYAEYLSSLSATFCSCDVIGGCLISNVTFCSLHRRQRATRRATRHVNKHIGLQLETYSPRDVLTGCSVPSEDYSSTVLVRPGCPAYYRRRAPFGFTICTKSQQRNSGISKKNKRWRGGEVGYSGRLNLRQLRRTFQKTSR
jgi:hypothetical protein